jgi:MFS family permease
VSKLATKWFADDERALATTIGSLATPLGCIMGMVIGPFFVLDSDKLDNKNGHIHVNNYMFFSAVLVSIFCLPVIIFFKESPDRFPSMAAMNQTQTKFSFSKDLKLLRKNKNYIWITISFMLLYGVYTCLGAIINNLVSPYGYTGG